MASQRGDSQPGAMGQARPYGEVFDRGYRHYEGRREGRSHAIRALVRYSVKRGFGIKKRWTAKLMPIALFTFAFFPVIIFIGIRAFVPVAGNALNYASLYQALSMLILLFASLTAPEMLCDDRRQHVLQLYFSRALSRADYLLAKIGALGLLTGAIAFLPAFFLFVGNVFLADSPVSYFGRHIADLGRIIAAGTLISLLYGSIALIAAAYMERKGIASAISVGVVLVGGGVVSALFAVVKASWHRYLILINPALIPEGLTDNLFNVQIPRGAPVGQAGLGGGWYVLSVLAITAVCGFVMYRRYLADE